MGVGGQHHVLAALPPVKTRYPLYRRLGGPQGRSGQMRKISPPTGIRSPDCPARTESLYRLSYPGPNKKILLPNIIRLRRQRNVACMGEMKDAQTVLVNKSKGKIPLWRTRGTQEDNIERVLRREEGTARTWLTWLRTVPATQYRELNNEPSGSTTCRELVTWLRND